jgi:ankyrin repeat protein
MAAVAMGGGGSPWTEIPRAQREQLALETVKLALELGADINAVNTDGRTALDAAKTLKFDSVVAYMTEKGAKPGVAPQRGGGRGGQ